MHRFYTSHSWQPNQRKWLERLARQLVFEVIVDGEFVNTCFAEDGGARRLDSVLSKWLEDLSEALHGPHDAEKRDLQSPDGLWALSG